MNGRNAHSGGSTPQSPLDIAARRRAAVPGDAGAVGLRGGSAAAKDRSSAEADAVAAGPDEQLLCTKLDGVDSASELEDDGWDAKTERREPGVGKNIS
jgi:hypothetical protein